MPALLYQCGFSKAIGLFGRSRHHGKCLNEQDLTCFYDIACTLDVVKRSNNRVFSPPVKGPYMEHFH
jgi:hypothetical protein